MRSRPVSGQANFDLYKLRPVDAAATCYTPALFGTGSGDTMIRPHHSQQIYDAYKGDKNLVTFDGPVHVHTSARSQCPGCGRLMLACCPHLGRLPCPGKGLDAIRARRFAGDHNELRPSFFLDSASIFLKTCMMVPEDLQLQIPLDGHGRQLGSFRADVGPSGRHGAGAFVRPSRDALEEAEDALVRQALLASLVSASAPAAGPARETEVASEVAQGPVDAETVSQVETRGFAPSGAPAVAETNDAAHAQVSLDMEDADEQMMLAQAIQLSLQER